MGAKRVLGIARILFCCVAFLPFAARAESPIARFVFITEPQAVPAAEMSGVCTIQAQNAAGESEQSGETIDLHFSSTSASGEFLSAAGEPVKTVMNKGTANRTFYYRDISPGTHTLAVAAVGRVSGQSWTASQEIQIGPAASAPVSTVFSPAVSAPAPGTISASPPAPAIEARAGPDRTAIAGAAVDFTGAAIGLLGAPIDNARFWWNFGDGAAAEGVRVSHIFRIPGTYTVGLHVSSGVYAGSDYLTVATIPNQVAIMEVVGGDAGFVRVRNNSDALLDIGGWIMEADGGVRFILPPRTLIRGKSVVSFAHTVTGFSGTPALTVRFPDGSFAFSYQFEPGMPVAVSASAPILPTAVVSSPAIKNNPTAERIAESAATPVAVASPHSDGAFSRSYAASAGTGASPARYSFFALAAFLSAGASAGFLFLKKFFP